MGALKDDPTLLGAAEVARAALIDIAEPDTVGEHLHAVMDAERLATHFFDCTARGYLGWHWVASVARAPRQKHATVCETSLLPGDGAVLAPAWVPYAERLAPGDLGASDVLPYRAEDANLMAGFEATGDEDVDATGFFELGLGRPRVLSATGRECAAQRWYDGGHGPSADTAQHASGLCTSCGYYVPMAGALRSVFGVCANEWSPADGSVVSLDHGCGAHSETDVPPPATAVPTEHLVDELALDTM